MRKSAEHVHTGDRQGPVGGLEPLAVSHTSPHQEAKGSTVGDQRICQKGPQLVLGAEVIFPEAEGSVPEDSYTCTGSKEVTSKMKMKTEAPLEKLNSQSCSEGNHLNSEEMQLQAPSRRSAEILPFWSHFNTIPTAAFLKLGLPHPEPH